MKPRDSLAIVAELVERTNPVVEAAKGSGTEVISPLAPPVGAAALNPNGDEPPADPSPARGVRLSAREAACATRQVIGEKARRRASRSAASAAAAAWVTSSPGIREIALDEEELAAVVAAPVGAALAAPGAFRSWSCRCCSCCRSCNSRCSDLACCSHLSWYSHMNCRRRSTCEGKE